MSSCTMPSHLALLPLLLAVLLLHSSRPNLQAHAYPEIHEWSYPDGCAHQPDMSERGHWLFYHSDLVMEDSSTAMQLEAQDDGAITTSLCPGRYHMLKVSFTVPGSSDPEDRRALLTSSLPSVSFNKNENDNKIMVDSLCPTRVYLSPHSPSRDVASSFSVPVTVGCDADGEVQIVVTSASCERDVCGLDSELRHAMLTAPVDWSCASPTCPSPPSSVVAPGELQAPLRPPATPEPPAAPEPPPSPTPPPQPPPSPPLPTGRGGCQGSSLGYECSLNIEGKMTLHWSATDLPPENACTGSTGSAANFSREWAEGASMLHMAAEAQVDGYVSVGFPTIPGTMYPADMVLGWVRYDQPYIQVFDVTDYEMVDEGINAADSWARNMAVVRHTPAGGPSSTVICFSRAMNDTRARHSPSLDPENLAYEWSVHNRPVLVEHDSGNYGSGILNLVKGSGELIDVEDRAWLVTLHAAFMLVAWLFLVPLGSLMPQHRWIMASRPPLWFTMHVSFQMGGALLTLGGLIIAFNKFPRAFDSAYDVAPYAEVWRSHAALGYIVIGLCGLQLILGFLRPGLDSLIRQYWGPLHSLVGRGSTLIAWASIGTGIATMYKRDGHADWKAWTITASILLGVIMIGGYVLDVLKPPVAKKSPTGPSADESTSMNLEKSPQDGKEFSSTISVVVGGKGSPSRSSGSPSAEQAAAV